MDARTAITINAPAEDLYARWRDFERLPTFGPYHQLLGPMYWKRADGGMVVGLRVQDKHRNRAAMINW